jgi:hypothetical protein
MQSAQPQDMSQGDMNGQEQSDEAIPMDQVGTDTGI